jgi:putative heme-binding domain-containing protein
VLDALGLLALREPSLVVRRALASGLQRLELDQRFGIARPLMARAEDAGDRNLPFLLWYGIEPLVAARPEQAFVLAREGRIERVARFVYRRAAAEAELRGPLVAEALRAGGDGRRLVLEELAAGVRDERGLDASSLWLERSAELLADADPAVREAALDIASAFGDPAAFAALRAILSDDTLPEERRLRALGALERGRDAQSAEAVLALLDGPPPLRDAAARALAGFEHAGVPAALLAHLDALSPAARRDAIATLVSRREWALALLDAVAAGRIAPAELSAFQLRALRAHGDPELDARLAACIGQVRPADETREAAIASLRAMLTEPGDVAADLAAGREVFARTCQQCHTLFGVGGTLGPDLTGANRSDLDYLLSNVLDPSGVVGNAYRTTVARLSDGRLVTGVERARTATSVTIETENERVTLGLDQVEELELSPLSTMPEGLLDALSPAEVRALFAYLQSPAQTSLRATAANVAGFFDGKSLAAWHGDPAVWTVEDGAIVGRTAGLAENSFLCSEYELGDFRLELDVRLVYDAGNSGIQFRSRALDGPEVAGYQADIGPGWWGKLYEEQGRGVLADPAAVAVHADGWNRYRIECVGERVRTWLNGQPCVDIVDPEGARRGFVALQVHSGGATEVRFRELALELLPTGIAGSR